MSSREHNQFLATWAKEAQGTIRLLRALPAQQYDFRPVADWRSLGELAWHLAEIDAYLADGAALGRIDFARKLPGLERPRAIADLAPGYERVHGEAFAKVRDMKSEDFDRMMPSFDGTPIRTGDLLWGALLHHAIHHRGQLVTVCRMAGGLPPGLYGPNREETMVMRSGA